MIYMVTINDLKKNRLTEIENYLYPILVKIKKQKHNSYYNISYQGELMFTIEDDYLYCYGIYGEFIEMNISEFNGKLIQIFNYALNIDISEVIHEYW